MIRRHARVLLIALIACTTVLLARCGMQRWQLAHPQRNHAMTTLTEHMRTHCIGRLLIDLPEGSNLENGATGGGARIGNIHISTATGISKEQFDVLIADRWAEINAKRNDDERYLPRPPERTSPIADGVVFAYGFRRSDGRDLDGVWRPHIYYDAEGYLWRDGTLFSIRPEYGKDDDAIAKLMPRLRALQAGEIPSEPGLCLNGGFVRGFYDMTEFEDASWNVSLPRALELRVEQGYTGQLLSGRVKQAHQEVAAFISSMAGALTHVVAGDTNYRSVVARPVNGLAGEEYVIGTSQNADSDDFETRVSAVWLSPAQGMPLPTPSIELSMDAAYRTSKRPSPLGSFPDRKDVGDGPTEEEYLAVWDAIIASIRIRPGALLQPPPPRDNSMPSRISREQAEADRRALDDFIASRPEDTRRKPRE